MEFAFTMDVVLLKILRKLLHITEWRQIKELPMQLGHSAA
jgi:hypothetical protein